MDVRRVAPQKAVLWLYRMMRDDDDDGWAILTRMVPSFLPALKVATGKSAVSSSSGGLNVRHVDWRSAASSIYQSEGLPGFFRGTLPRVMSHTPAVAISWTTYEAAKRYLMGSYSGQ